MDLIKEIFQTKIILLVVPGDTYNSSLLKFIKKIDKRKICYVTINKGYTGLIEIFKKNHINFKNFTYVDCVTKTITDPKKVPNCVFVPSPNDLTEISLAITKFIYTYSSVILIDSLSTLLVYHQPKKLTSFIHSIVNRIRESEAILILTISSRDIKTELFKQVEVLVDEVIKLKK